MKSDVQIHHDVMAELAWDTRVDATDLGIEVERGVVTLTGSVSSYAKKRAAQDAAHRVAGVLDVANDLTVGLPSTMTQTDAELAPAVRRALSWDALVPDEKIRCTVSDGLVTLEGSVDVWQQREEAETAVWRLAGIRGVTNNLLVIAPKAEAREIRDLVEHALVRRAEREAHRITVEADGGVVTLSGRVGSWHEKQAIVGTAGHAPGTHMVIDKLLLDTTD